MEKVNLSFNELPEAVSNLLLEVKEIKQLLIKHDKPQTKEHEKFIDIDEVARYLRKSRFTIYGLVHKGKIPYHKFGRKLYFKISEIEALIEANKCKSIDEFTDEAHTYLKKKGGRNYEK